MKVRSSTPGIKEFKIFHTKQRTGSRSFYYPTPLPDEKRKQKTIGDKCCPRVHLFVSYNLIPGPGICDNPPSPGGEL